VDDQNILPFIINQSFFQDQRLTPACRQAGPTISEKESPDVETPGLLVKALISSYFKKIVLYQVVCKYNFL
jgi:hypothetical protein